LIDVIVGDSAAIIDAKEFPDILYRVSMSSSGNQAKLDIKHCVSVLIREAKQPSTWVVRVIRRTRRQQVLETKTLDCAI
jgi:hypothetical protein